MAISHNIITSGTRGSIGDVTLRQQDGKTVISQKASVVSNPKTYGQALQRMRMAAVTKFYSPLSAVLEQAWQGKNTRQSYSEFLSSALRTIAEYNPPLGVRRSWPFFPLPVQVSRGSLRQFPYALNASGSTFSFSAWTADFADNLGGLSKLLVNGFGMHNGDYCTFLIVLAEADGYRPCFFRVTLDTQSTDNDFSTWLSPLGLEILVSAGSTSFGVVSANTYIAAGAVILSAYRRGVWRRSTQSLAVAADYIAVMQNNFEGSIYDYMSTEASQGAPASDVYLNGDTSRRASSDDGSIIDPSSLLWGSGEANATALGKTALSVVPVNVPSVGNVVGVEFTDGTQAALTGGDRAVRFYHKLWPWGSPSSVVDVPQGTTATLVCPGYQGTTDTEKYDNQCNCCQWVADTLDLPISVFFG